MLEKANAKKLTTFKAFLLFRLFFYLYLNISQFSVSLYIEKQTKNKFIDFDVVLFFSLTIETKKGSIANNTNFITVLFQLCHSFEF